MFQTLKKNRWFLIPYLILFTTGLITLSLWDKKTVHLWSSTHHSPFFDHLFSWCTHVGDGYFVLLVAFVLLFYRMSYSLFVLSTYVLSALTAQIIKHIVKAPRPLIVFYDEQKLHIVEGIKLLTTNSFPSGHSTSAFALFLTLSIITKYNKLRVFFLICAVFVAYSRVYLSEHFLMDILIGSAIGVGTVLIYLIFHLRIKDSWLSKPIYKLQIGQKKTKTNNYEPTR